MATPEKLAEAFKIFAKYSDESYPVCASHEEIKVWVNPEEVTQEDIETLENIGFHKKPKSETPHFYYFT